LEALWPWLVFNLFILLMLALDLGVLRRNSHEVTLKEAAVWSVAWVAMSLIFNAGVYYFMGQDAGLAFLTGYLIEKALSIDNIFVFVLLFSYFQVPPQYQHRILFWGVLGALVMRGVMIAAGAVLIAQYHSVMYVFGAFLVITGIRMATQREHSIKQEANPVIRLLQRFMPFTDEYHGQKFFIKQLIGGRTRFVATPLFLVLVMVETTDLVFAVDSIPAIFAITQDAFLVYTSNVFAILGLRSLYFLLVGVIHKFHFLKLGLSAILVFVGLKMLVADSYKVPVGLSLAVIALLLIVSIVASFLFPKSAHENVSALGAAADPHRADDLV
jgi:tellurite resistance protein TerC